MGSNSASPAQGKGVDYYGLLNISKEVCKVNSLFIHH